MHMDYPKPPGETSTAESLSNTDCPWDSDADVAEDVVAGEEEAEGIEAASRGGKDLKTSVARPKEMLGPKITSRRPIIGERTLVTQRTMPGVLKKLKRSRLMHGDRAPKLQQMHGDPTKI